MFGASAGTWAKYAKIMFLLGIVGDIVFFVGGYWLFTTQPSVRLFIGQWAPPLQDAFYMLLHQYKGQDFVLECRDADEQEAANMFVQARYAHGFTRQEWYKLPVLWRRYQFEDEQDEMLRQARQQQSANKGGGLLQNLARGVRG